jgi:hypothetical protein
VRKLAVGFVVVVLTLASGASAWAATAHPKKKAAHPANVSYGKKYVSIVAPANAAGATFLAGVKALPPTPSAAQLQNITVHYASTLTTVDKKLAAVRWPAAAEADVHVLSADIRTVASDVTAFGNASSLTADTVLTQLNDDLGKTGSAVAQVRRDLGLPPAKD